MAHLELSPRVWPFRDEGKFGLARGHGGCLQLVSPVGHFHSYTEALA